MERQDMQPWTHRFYAECGIDCYDELNKEAQRLYEELENWLNEHTDAGAVFVTDIFTTETPKGELRNEGEYCYGHAYGASEDLFMGEYYLPVEGSNLFLGYGFDC